MKTEDSKRAFWGILILVATFFFVLMLFAFYTVKTLKSSSSEIEKKGDKIAVIEINGVIMRSKNVIEKLHQAVDKKDYKAIILRINSPGGAVGPVQEIYEEILDIDKKIPVYSSLGSIAASGGYYIAASTRKIYANAGTMTGSIGVIMNFMDMSKLYQWAKVSPFPIKAGKFKDIGSPHRTMRPEELSLMEELMNNVHKQFISDIEKKRKKKIKGKLIDLAQGQLFSGEMAKSSGLVDEIGSLWQAGRDIHASMKLEGELNLIFIEKKKKSKFFKLLDSIDTLVLTMQKISLRGETKPMYLYQ